MNIYVASSWKNPHQPWVLRALRSHGYEVYDFRNTDPLGAGAFKWDQIDPKWEGWDFPTFHQALGHPLAMEAFSNDRSALLHADVGILILPCGASSHLEIGYLKGLGKHTAIFMLEGRPELMYNTVDLLTNNFEELAKWLHTLEY